MSKKHPKGKRTAPNWVLVGIALGLAFWIIDPLIDSYLTRGGSLRQTMFSPDSSDIWIRSFVMFLFLCFGAFVEGIFSKKVKAEQDLQKGLSLLMATLESTADGILVVNQDGDITSYNGRFQELWQIPQDILEERNDKKAIQHVLNRLKDPQSFINKVKELYNNPDAESFDILEFTDGRIIERYSRPQKIGGISVGRVWSFRDVTARDQAEKALRESEERFRRLYDSAPLGYQSLDETGHILNVNRTWVHMMGYAETEITGRPFTDFLAPGDIKLFQKSYPLFKDKGEIHDVQFTLKRKDGTLIDLSFDGKIEKDGNGRFSRTHYIMHDVTQIKRAEDSLRQSESRFRELAELLPETIIECDLNGVFTFVNLHGCQVFGYKREEVEKRMNMFEMLDPSEIERARQNVGLVFKGDHRRNIEYLARKRDGSTIPVALHSSPIYRDDQVVGMRSVVVDISEQKNAAATLRFRLDFEHLVTTISARLMGLSNEKIDAAIEESLKSIGEFAGVDNCHLFFFSDDTESVRYTSEWCGVGTPRFAEKMQGKQPQKYYQGFEQLCRMEPVKFTRLFESSSEGDHDREFFGNLGIKSMVSVPLASGGRLIGTIGMAAIREERIWTDDDMALLRMAGEVLASALERKWAEESLQENENKYRTLFESSPDGLFLMKEVFLDCNEQVCRLWKCSRENIIGHSPSEFSPEKQPNGRKSTESAKEKIEAAMGGDPQTFYWMHQDINGVCQDTEVHLQALVLKGERFLLARVRDISQQKNAEMSLRQAEERFSRTFNFSPVAACLTDLATGKIINANERLEEIFKLSREDLLGNNTLALGIWNSREERDIWISKLSGGETVRNLEITRTLPQGDRRDFSVSMAIIPLNDDKCLLTLIDDITDRKLAAEALRESEERYRYLYNNAEVGLFRTAIIDGLVLECNDRAAEIFGYASKEEMINQFRVSQHYVDPSARERFIEEMSRTGETSNYKIRFFRKGGSVIWVSLSAKIHPEKGYIDGVFYDITDQKRAEEELVKLSHAVEQSPVTVVVTDTNGTIEYVNPKFTELTGYSREEALGQNPRVLKSGETSEAEYKKLWETIAAGGEWRGEFHNRKKNGELFWERAQISPIKNEKGAITHFVAIKEDITQRKQAEAALVESEERFRRIFEEGPLGMALAGSDYRFLKVNAAFCEMIGYTEQEFMHLTFKDITHPDYLVQNEDSVKQLLAGEISQFRTEKRYIRKDGKTVWGNVSINAVRDKEDRFLYFLDMIEDISDRKVNEEILHKTQFSIDHASDMAFWLDSSGRLKYINNAAVNILGYTREELLRFSVWDINPCFDETKWSLYWEGLKKAGTLTIESQLHSKDGKVFSTEVCANYLEYGGKEYDFGFVRDITQRKKTESDLLESRRTLETLMNNLPGMAYRYANNPQWTMEFVSDGCFELTGYNPQDILNNNKMSFNDIIHPDDRDSVQAEIAKALQMKKPFRLLYHIVTAQNEVKWVWEQGQGIANKDGEIIALEGFITDISDRIRAEEELRDERGLFIAGPVVVFKWRNEASYPADYVSPNIMTEYGYKAEDFLSGRFYYRDIVHPDDKIRIQSEARAFIDRGALWYEQEYRIIDAQGRYRWVDDFTRVIRDSRGAITHFHCYLLDVTNRKRAENMLAAETNRLTVTLQSIGDGVIACDTEGRIVLINRVAEELTGWKNYDGVGQKIEDVFHIVNRNTREICPNPVQNVLSSGEASELAADTLLLSKDGNERLLADSVAPIKDEAGQTIGAVLVFRDITERERIEAELAKAEKLDSLGILAGGIAHDFNNILTGIMGNISMVMSKIDDGAEIYKRLADAEKATLRAQDLTQQLLTFAKGGTPIKKAASIAELVRESAKFALRGSDVSCEFAFEDDLLPVEIDSGQISRVISNLVINADQAMPKGGVITIDISNVYGTDDNPLPIHGKNGIKISVKDQGTGIPEQNLRKIFDPFFTTKPKGNGLGLATTYSIITKHDGHIAVESNLNVGTTFHIYLPASESETPSQTDFDDAAIPGHGKILIMDDDDGIRTVACIALTELGYQVDLASDGIEAVARYKEALDSGARYDAVIMDLTIPGGLGGIDTIKLLRDIDPQIKAIVSSGYSNAPVLSDYLKYGFKGFARKPYRVQQLSRILYEVLHSDLSDSRAFDISDIRAPQGN